MAVQLDADARVLKLLDQSEGAVAVGAGVAEEDVTALVKLGAQLALARLGARGAVISHLPRVV